MKVLKSVFFILAVALSGCAHHVGHYRSYGGYGGGYGMRSNYGYVGGSYYRPDATIYYGRQSVMPRSSRRHHWQNVQRRSSHHRHSNGNRDHVRGWNPNVSNVGRPHFGTRSRDGRFEHRGVGEGYRR